MADNIPAGGAARDYYEERYGCDAEEPGCDCCGGEGFVELQDHPELWDEDCFVEENRLVTCPECGGLPTVAEDQQRQGADSPYVATIDPSAAQDHGPSRNNAIPTVAALQEATETPIAQSAPATNSVPSQGSGQ